jgi:glycosyltransferase involved in cell wall biosynthesis
MPSAPHQLSETGISQTASDRVGAERERPRLLLLVYACSPDRGSEPGTGWNRALQAARDFETWVITEDEDYGTPIRAYLRKHGPIPGVHFVYVPKSTLVRLLRYRLGLYYTALRIWNRDAYRTARRLHDELRFDLVHHVNFMTYREPGYLWKLDAPFVWGPWGGAQHFPWRFLPLAGWRGAMKEAARSVVNTLELHLARRPRIAARRAALVMASNAFNQQAFASAHGVTPHILAGNGIARMLGPAPPREGSTPIRLLWVGRLEDLKALPLVLRALAQLPDGVDYQLRVMGQGPRRGAWQRDARRLGIDDRITWLPSLTMQQVYDEYLRSDIFVFSSMRETVPTVIIEALSAGLPIIYLNHQGMGEMVPESCGIGVPVHSPRQVASDLAAAIADLANDPGARERMGAAALTRAETYLWDRQGEEINRRLWQVLRDARARAQG